MRDQLLDLERARHLAPDHELSLGSSTREPRASPLGGRGMLPSGVPGVAAGRVMIVGGGAVEISAAVIASRYVKSA